MRIGNNSALSKGTIAVIGAAFALGFAASAHADPASPSLTAPATISASATPPAPPKPSAVAGDQSIPKTPEMEKSVGSLEDKTTENARDLVKSLDGSDALTVDELNRARQTVARIEALIDVEKKLVELNKLRNERTEAPGSLAGAIPASALVPPSKFAMPPPMMGFPTATAIRQTTPAMAPIEPHSATEISRIEGTDGKYTAVLRFTNGEIRTVRAGDQITGGATVRWISPTAVELEEKGGATQTLHVKNVDVVYSASR